MSKLTEEAYSEAEEQMSENLGYKRFSPDAGLVVKSHKERSIDNGVEILAEIENTGADTWSSINVEVELFDQDGQFIDECSSYVSGKLPPHIVKNVKIKCGGCKDNPLPEYASYTINVVDASSF